MKKILLILVAVICCTFISIADNNSCRVYGAKNDNVASIIQASQTAGENGKILIKVALTKPAEEETTIVVNVKEGSTHIGTAHVIINKNVKTPTNGYWVYENSNIIKGHTYNFSISNASCR